MNTRWSQGVWEALVDLGDRLVASLPALLVMATLLLLGFVLGWIVRALVSRITRAVGFDRYMEQWGVGPTLRRSGILRTPADALGLVAFWVVFVLFASLAIDALAVPGAGSAVGFLLALLPPFFAALLILVVGWVVANFVSQGLLIAAVNAGVPEARLLARAAHWGIILFAIATALTQLGIGKEMVLVAFGIIFGGLVFALALAFGLGGRGIAHDLLRRRRRRDEAPPEERLTHL
jgi:hypothetical protein